MMPLLNNLAFMPTLLFWVMHIELPLQLPIVSTGPAGGRPMDDGKLRSLKGAPKPG